MSRTTRRSPLTRMKRGRSVREFPRPYSENGERAFSHIPDHASRRCIAQQADGIGLVDVPDEAVVDTVSRQLLQARLELRCNLAWYAELLVFLLADVPGTVVHG